MEGWKLTSIIYLSTTFLKACFWVRKMISGVVICAVSWGSQMDLMKVKSSVAPGGSKVTKLGVEILMNVKKHNYQAGTTNRIWSESKHGPECQSIISLINQSGSNQKDEIEDDLIPKDNTQTHTHTNACQCDHNTLPVQCVCVCIEMTSVLQETLTYNNCSKVIPQTAPPVH